MDLDSLNETFLQSAAASLASLRPNTPLPDEDNDHGYGGEDIPFLDDDSLFAATYSRPSRRAESNYFIMPTTFKINAPTNKLVPYPIKPQGRLDWTNAQRKFAAKAYEANGREAFVKRVSHLLPSAFIC